MLNTVPESCRVWIEAIIINQRVPRFLLKLLRDLKQTENFHRHLYTMQVMYTYWLQMLYNMQIHQCYMQIHTSFKNITYVYVCMRDVNYICKLCKYTYTFCKTWILWKQMHLKSMSIKIHTLWIHLKSVNKNTHCEYISKVCQ